MSYDPYWVFENYNNAASLLDNLEKENAELRAKLDAWEKQEPLTHVIVRTEDITIGMDGFDSGAKLKVPLFTRPKEE